MIYVSRVVNLLVSTTVGRVVIYARGGFIRFAAGRGAAIAQWIRLRLSSCRPRFESQAHHLRFL